MLWDVERPRHTLKPSVDRTKHPPYVGNIPLRVLPDTVGGLRDGRHGEQGTP